MSEQTPTAESVDATDFPEYLEVKLRRPVLLGDREISKLVFSEPKIKDLAVMDRVKGDVAQTIALVSAMSGEPTSVIDRLHPMDFQEASNAIGRFFAVGRSLSE